MMRTRLDLTRWTLSLGTLTLGLALLLPACSDGGTPAKGDGAVPDGKVGTTGTLQGLVKDATGKVLGDATVTVGTLTTKTNFKGEYNLAGLAPAARIAVKVTAPWFQEQSQEVEIKAGQTTTLDVTLVEMALKLDSADAKLAAGDAAGAGLLADEARSRLELARAKIEADTKSPVRW